MSSDDPIDRWDGEGGAWRVPPRPSRHVRPFPNIEREQEEACYRESGVDLERRAVDHVLDTPARGIPGTMRAVPDDAPLTEVIAILLEGSVGALAVRSQTGDLTGVITPTAVLRAVAGRLAGPSALTASDCAAPVLSRLQSDDPVRHVLAQTEVGGESWHIPVVDADEHPIALLSSADVLRFLVSELWPTGMGCTLTALPEAAAREGG